jgi:hypothetical protein
LIDVSPNIGAYFEEIVHDAVRARRADATETAEHYLAELLSDYARGGAADEPSDRPFTFQLRDALETRGATRFERLRQIGDRVLYAMGFFRGHLRRRGADPEYVMSVGSSAYGHASAMLRMGAAGGGPDVFTELSERFSVFVGVMTEIADGAMANASDDTSILRAYERWQRTKSPVLARALGSMGFIPVTGSGGTH